MKPIMLEMLNSKSATPGGRLAASHEICPGFFDPYCPLSELLIKQKRLEAERLRYTAQEDQESWQWPYELAMCYGKMSQWDKGIAMGRLALERKNPPARTRLLLADLYSNKGETSKAIVELETFKKENPKSPMIPRVDEVLEWLRKLAPGDGPR
jgi:tetratricopeptide (TPR) repeat protein